MYTLVFLEEGRENILRDSGGHDFKKVENPWRKEYGKLAAALENLRDSRWWEWEVVFSTAEILLARFRDKHPGTWEGISHSHMW